MSLIENIVTYGTDIFKELICLNGPNWFSSNPNFTPFSHIPLLSVSLHSPNPLSSFMLSFLSPDYSRYRFMSISQVIDLGSDRFQICFKSSPSSSWIDKTSSASAAVVLDQIIERRKIVSRGLPLYYYFWNLWIYPN